VSKAISPEGCTYLDLACQKLSLIRRRSGPPSMMNDTKIREPVAHVIFLNLTGWGKASIATLFIEIQRRLLAVAKTKLCRLTRRRRGCPPAIRVSVLRLSKALRNLLVGRGSVWIRPSQPRAPRSTWSNTPCSFLLTTCLPAGHCLARWVFRSAIKAAY
jgi:hypothetical protein